MDNKTADSKLTRTELIALLRNTWTVVVEDCEHGTLEILEALNTPLDSSDGPTLDEFDPNDDLDLLLGYTDAAMNEEQRYCFTERELLNAEVDPSGRRLVTADGLILVFLFPLQLRPQQK